MIRSRFFLMVLMLVYVGVTPIGVYTCACLIPSQPDLSAADGDRAIELSPVPKTAAAALANFLTLSFFLFASVVGAHFFQPDFACFPARIELRGFKSLPPTPPPKIA